MNTEQLVGSGVYWTTDFEEQALRNGWALVTQVDDEGSETHSIKAVGSGALLCDESTFTTVKAMAAGGCHVSAVAVALVLCSQVHSPSVVYGEFTNEEEEPNGRFNKYQMYALSTYKGGRYSGATQWLDLEGMQYDPALMTLIEELDVFDDSSPPEEVAGAVTELLANMMAACSIVKNRLHN